MSSINIVLLGSLAKDFNQAVNQGVGPLFSQQYDLDRNMYEGTAVMGVFFTLKQVWCVIYISKSIEIYSQYDKEVQHIMCIAQGF